MYRVKQLPSYALVEQAFDLIMSENKRFKYNKDDYKELLEERLISDLNHNGQPKRWTELEKSINNYLNKYYIMLSEYEGPNDFGIPEKEVVYLYSKKQLIEDMDDKDKAFKVLKKKFYT